METIDLALGQVVSLRRYFKRNASKQVSSNEERTTAKATALAWFNSLRAPLSGLASSTNFQSADNAYRQLLDATGRATSRTVYDDLLKGLRQTLVALRTESATQTPATTTSDQAPSFARLIPDPRMQTILAERWNECVKCIEASAPLSATVMMGGLLEALLLSRINREANKAPIFQATTSPKDKNGQTKALGEWGLKNYIDVAHELGWISISAKDVGEVLRDYRNYIHPFKQLSHGVNLTDADAAILWEVGKGITRQVIKSVGP